jgi:nucleotide-binding universal stress UspA family protein
MSSARNDHGVTVAVDGSSASKVAVDWAARTAARRHVPLALVHVEPDPVIGMWPEPAMPEEFSTWRRDNGHQILEQARRVADRAILDYRPVAVEQRSYAGATVPTLVDLSKETSLMVVGRRGLGSVKRLLLGSTSTGLLHHAHCPVAVIHDEDPLVAHFDQAPVVVGIDGSPASESAVAIAFNEASLRGVGLIAMHSWADRELREWAGIDWAQQFEIGKEVLAERLAGWREHHPDVAVDHRLVYGDPAQMLLAASESAQLTVVGSHGRGGFAGMLVGSVSSAVVQGARMPVIVARQP